MAPMPPSPQPPELNWLSQSVETRGGAAPPSASAAAAAGCSPSSAAPQHTRASPLLSLVLVGASCRPSSSDPMTTAGTPSGCASDAAAAAAAVAVWLLLLLPPTPRARAALPGHACGSAGRRGWGAGTPLPPQLTDPPGAERPLLPSVGAWGYGLCEWLALWVWALEECAAPTLHADAPLRADSMTEPPPPLCVDGAWAALTSTPSD